MHTQTFVDSLLACHERGLSLVMCAREDAMVGARQYRDDADTAARLRVLSSELKVCGPAPLAYVGSDYDEPLHYE